MRSSALDWSRKFSLRKKVHRGGRAANRSVVPDTKRALEQRIYYERNLITGAFRDVLQTAKRIVYKRLHRPLRGRTCDFNFGALIRLSIGK